MWRALRHTVMGTQSPPCRKKLSSIQWMGAAVSANTRLPRGSLLSRGFLGLLASWWGHRVSCKCQRRSCAPWLPSQGATLARAPGPEVSAVKVQLPPVPQFLPSMSLILLGVSGLRKNGPPGGSGQPKPPSGH